MTIFPGNLGDPVAQLILNLQLQDTPKFFVTAWYFRLCPPTYITTIPSDCEADVFTDPMSYLSPNQQSKHWKKNQNTERLSVLLQ